MQREERMSELKVRFLPESGLAKSGAFIEYESEEPTGEEAEYQLQSYQTLDIACSDLKVETSLEVICVYENIEKRQYGRVIGATGVIQPARWGRYYLSFLGEKRKTDRIAINTRENAIDEAATLAGLKMESDLDIKEVQNFFLEINLHHDRFAVLLKELSIPEAALHISVRADHFRDFYARWSPSISEGRMIKFLDNKRDVENADEIPENFWRSSEFQRELLSNSDSPPATISVGRPLHRPSDGGRTGDE